MATKSINELIDVINKKYKKKIALQGNDLREYTFIPYSTPKMNYLTRGGVPENKMIMYAGVGNSGKTTTALDSLHNFQLKYPDRFAVYLDAENTLNKEWGELLGIDWDKVILLKPENEYGEELLDMVLDLIRSGDVGFVVIDSVPFIIAKAMYEEDLEKKGYGGNSALITAFCTKVIPLMNLHNVTVIMINQVRDKFGVTYTAYNLPGGRMLYHSCVQVLFFSKGSLFDENGKEQTGSYESPAGNIVNVKIEKNKATKSDRRLGAYTLNYYSGIDVLTDTVDLAILLNVVRQAGSWFMYTVGEEEQKFQGKAKLVDYLRTNPVLINTMIEELAELNA